jgi:hypothetical protein
MAPREEVEVLDEELLEEELEQTLEPSEPVTIDVILTARTPILMHKYSPAQGPKKMQAPTTSYLDEWKTTCYTDNIKDPSNGHLCIPDYCIKATIMAAGRSKKIGKLYLKKYIASGVIINEQFPLVLVKGKAITIDDVEKNDWIHTCGAVVGKSRVDRRRARIANWELRFTIKLDSPLITPQILHEILIAASTNEGLLDQRPGSPNKPGEFGQFYVSKFEVCP